MYVYAPDTLSSSRWRYWLQGRGGGAWSDDLHMSIWPRRGPRASYCRLAGADGWGLDKTRRRGNHWEVSLVCVPSKETHIRSRSTHVDLYIYTHSLTHLLTHRATTANTISHLSCGTHGLKLYRLLSVYRKTDGATIRIGRYYRTVGFGCLTILDLFLVRWHC